MIKIPVERLNSLLSCIAGKVLNVAFSNYYESRIFCACH